MFVLIFDMFVVSFDVCWVISCQFDLNPNQLDLEPRSDHLILLRPVRVYGNEGIFIYFTKSSRKVTAQGDSRNRCCMSRSL